jgi:hypothetical protein
MKLRLTAFVVTVAVLALNPLAATRAAGLTPTVLAVTAPAATLYTERIEIRSRLITARGVALRDRLLVLLVDGVAEQRRRTDAHGKATFSISRDITRGRHVVAVRFTGDGRYAATSRSVTIRVLPATLRVRTLPPVPGALFEFRGKRFRTRDDGSALVVIGSPARPGEVPTFLSAPSSPGTFTVFGKWWGRAPDLTAGFDLYYETSMRFTDRLGADVDPDTIESVTLRSSIGEIIKLPEVNPVWVHGARVVSLAGGLEAKDILYVVDDVEIKGANVVNRAQQRFAPRESRAWNVELLFYQTSIELRDLIFGFPISATVRIDYPNGDAFRVQTDAWGIVDLPPLPRGTYHVTPERAGVTVTQALAMSRDANVHLTVITYLDVAVGLAVPTAIAIGLLLLGRPHLLLALRALLRKLSRTARPLVADVKAASSSLAGLSRRLRRAK